MHGSKQCGVTSPSTTVGDRLLSALAAGNSDARPLFEARYGPVMDRMLHRLQLPPSLLESVSDRVMATLFDAESPHYLGGYSTHESFVRFVRRSVLEIIMGELGRHDASSMTSDFELGLEGEEHRMIHEIEPRIRDVLPTAFAEGWMRLSEPVRERLCAHQPTQELNPDQARWVSETRKALIRHTRLDIDAIALTLPVIEERLDEALRALSDDESTLPMM